MPKVIDGVTVPDNAQEGGWYGGRQLWGGKLGAPGVIINPNQAGAGQAVSSAVVAQTNPNNVGFLQKQGFADQSQVQQHLNALQNGVFQNYQGADVPRVQTASEIASDLKGSGLLPTTPAPTAPKMLDQYTQLAQEKGLGALEKDINDLKAEEEAAIAQFRVNKAGEEGKPVATNVIEGRVSEQERTARENLDFIQRKRSRKLDEYNSALNSINMIMSFTQTDYQNALNSYNSQFEQAMSTINLVRGIQNDQKSERDKAMDNARANAQIYVNAITAGNMDINSLPDDQRLQLNKLEAQSGLPIGFFSSLRKDPKADIIATTSNGGQIQVLMRNPDGTMSLQKHGTPTNNKPQFGFAPPASSAATNPANDIWQQVLSSKPPATKKPN